MHDVASSCTSGHSRIQFCFKKSRSRNIPLPIGCNPPHNSLPNEERLKRLPLPPGEIAYYAYGHKYVLRNISHSSVSLFIWGHHK